MGFLTIERPDEKTYLAISFFESSISRNIIVKPKIVTTDENLRRFTPEQ